MNYMHFKKRPAGILIIIFLATMGVRQVALAQDEPVVFTASTNSIPVDVAVRIDQRPVAGLVAEDFILTDNGQRQPIKAFSSEEVPLDIVLVCRSVLVGRAWAPPAANGSRGMPEHYLEPRSAAMAQRLIDAAVSAVLPARTTDRIAMVTYGTDPRILLNFTNDADEILDAIKSIGSTDQADENVVITSEALAIEYAVRMLADLETEDPAARTNRRRLIVMISNPFGVGTRYADEPIIRRLWEKDILFSVIDNRLLNDSATDVQRPEGGESQSILFRRYNPVHIAQATGGDRILAHDVEDRPDLLTPIRQRYTLWFDQPQGLLPGQLRTIRVELSGQARTLYPNAELIAREGYLAR